MFNPPDDGECAGVATSSTCHEQPTGTREEWQTPPPPVLAAGAAPNSRETTSRLITLSLSLYVYSGEAREREREAEGKEQKKKEEREKEENILYNEMNIGRGNRELYIRVGAVGLARRLAYINCPAAVV